VKGFQGAREYDSDTLLKTIKFIVCIICKFVIILRHDQSTADSAVNKNRDLIILLVQSWIY